VGEESSTSNTIVRSSTSALTTDQDAPNSTSAMRLGWTLAQVGGRYRQGAQSRPTLANNLPTFVLTVSEERSELELAIQTETAFRALTQQFNVDFALRDLTGMSSGPANLDASGYLRVLTEQILESIKESDSAVKLSLTRLQSLLWAWNEAIEDRLHGRSLGLHAAYELGLCLGEVWWSRDPGPGTFAVRLLDALAELATEVRPARP